MNLELLKKTLSELRRGILIFQEKKMEIINIPPEKIKIDEEYYKKHDLENNPKLKNALTYFEHGKVSDKIKKEVYNYKSGLKKEYGKLEKYIKIFGLNPGINNLSCYDAFFLNDNWNSENNNFSSIISDIDIILGKLDNVNNKEFNAIVNLKNKNYWKIYNPIYWFLVGLKLGWKHKILSVIILAWISYIMTESFKPLLDIIVKPISEFLSGSLKK